MAITKNLCAQLPIDLHERVSEVRERLGQTTSEYITKRHLERETLRSGKKLTQRDFVLNLITQALDEADAENTAEQNAPH